ncbi:M56 family metallopeptidase [Spirosoma panaciterrae]|uniref:M56 family metallopeptidase n=1 Tax=Spirosoma panaciterrae TaxID=496058 RepID=UPI0003769889|nr:M56 family metallopeptidase [Spirosoma panaciterrae]
MNAFHFLSNPVADALGWTLIHAIWQGFALVLPLAIVLHVLRKRSSTLRYQVGVATLSLQVLASLVTFFWYYKPAVATTTLPVYGHKALLYPVRWQTMTQTLPWPQQLQQFLEIHLSQFVLVYLIGVALFGLRLAGGWLYLQRLSRTALQPATKGWAQMTDRLRSAMGIRGLIQVRESARIAVPMVVGVIKPVLLLPIGLAANLSIREIEAVLAHELAHIKRYDYAVNLLQSVVEVLYFFHPALWWLSARVREEREHCCDDLAVQVCGGDGRVLAQALARIEELRLTQQIQAPSLAMAFASKRQQLLHRVRRVLGVPTKPFISNSSLAGLTLVTILLMSVSVYAVQKQDTPKHTKVQPRPMKTTRKHKVDSRSEYGMADDSHISYVVWKGQLLSAERITRLQHQLDGVMAGQLSLDAVPQTDRDILLTIIEKNYAFESGMASLSEGLSHIDLSNMSVGTATHLPDVLNEPTNALSTINQEKLIRDALAPLSGLVPHDSLDRLRTLKQRKMDSLGQLMQQQTQHIQSLQLQMEKMQFPIEESERSQQMLEWRKQKLMQQRMTLIEKQRQMMHQEGKQKATLDEVEKQVAALEPEIKKQEERIEEINQQIEAAQTRMMDARKPLEKLEHETQELNQRLERLSEEMGQYGDQLSNVDVDVKIDGDFNLSAPDAYKSELEYDLRNVRPKIRSTPRAARPARTRVGFSYGPTPPAPPAAAARPSARMKAPAAPAVVPDAHVVPDVDAPAPPARTAKPAAPRSTPKPPTAPKPEDQSSVTPALNNEHAVSVRSLVAKSDKTPTAKTASITLNTIPTASADARPSVTTTVQTANSKPTASVVSTNN